MSNNSDTLIYIPFSGGFDSTYLIRLRLKQGYKVRSTYFSLLNNPEKTKRELKATRKLNKLFQKEFPGQFTYNIGSSIDVNVRSPFSLVFIQQPIWLLLAALDLSDDIDCMELPIIIGDDDISYMKEFTKIYKALMLLGPKKYPKIGYPLYQTTKRSILNDLPKKYKKHCTYCESVSIKKGKKSCGKCIKCIEMKKYIKKEK